MKAFTNPNENGSIGWPHPSLCGEVAGFPRRRAQSNRYPDFGFKPHSAFPLPVALEFVAVTVAQPLRIFTGFPDIRLHRWQNFFCHFKERVCFTLNKKNFKTIRFG